MEGCAGQAVREAHEAVLAICRKQADPVAGRAPCSEFRASRPERRICTPDVSCSLEDQPARRSAGSDHGAAGIHAHAATQSAAPREQAAEVGCSNRCPVQGAFEYDTGCTPGRSGRAFWMLWLGVQEEVSIPEAFPPAHLLQKQHTSR
jgi:hypothetical protein